MNSRIHQTIQLARGSCHLAPVVPDTRILLRRGTIGLRPPPEWLADTFCQTTRRLAAEESHVMAARGYVELTAMADAEVLIIPPEPLFPSLGERLARIGQLMRQLCRRLGSLRHSRPQP